MTHAERRERREKVASYVRDHGSTWEAVAHAAQKFGVSEKTVTEACREWEVKLNRIPRAPSEVLLLIVADLLNTKDTQVAIAQRHRVSPQYVSQVYLQCQRVRIGVGVRRKAKL